MVLMHPQAGHTRAPGWGVIFGHPWSALPPPAPRMAPAAHGFRQDRAAVLGRTRGRAGRPTPPGAAPALGLRGGCEDRAQGAHAPGPQARDPHRARALTVWGDP
jgi:hypothetical protein